MVLSAGYGGGVVGRRLLVRIGGWGVWWRGNGGCGGGGTSVEWYGCLDSGW